MGTFGATQTVGVGESAIAHTDLQATASSATILLAPLTYSGSAARVVLFHAGVTKFAVRLRGSYTAATVNPIVCIYMVYPRDGNLSISPGDTAIPDTGTILTRRVYDSAGGTNITLDATVATNEKDSVYKYSPLGINQFFNTLVGYSAAATDPGGFATPHIMRDGAIGCIVLTQTLGAVSGASDTLEAQVLAF